MKNIFLCTCLVLALTSLQAQIYTYSFPDSVVNKAPMIDSPHKIVSVYKLPVTYTYHFPDSVVNNGPVIIYDPAPLRTSPIDGNDMSISYKIVSQEHMAIIHDKDITTIHDSITLQPINSANYTPVLNGVIIKSEVSVDVEHVLKTDNLNATLVKDKFGYDAQGQFFVLITHPYGIQYDIDSVLLKRNDGNISAYRDYIRYFAIAINGRLVSNTDREKMLGTLKLQDIKNITYIKAPYAAAKYPDAPFGVIELELK